MNANRVSRREMLKLMGVTTAGAILAACAGAAPAPAPAATSAGGASQATQAPKPTEAAKPAATQAPTPVPTVVAKGGANAVTLTLWTWGGTTGAESRDAGLRKAYTDLADKYTVQFVVAGGGDFEVANALRLSLAAGKGMADMIQFNRTQVAEFAAADELLDLGPVYQPYQADMYAGALELVRYKDKLVCFPFELKSKMFYYRADMFDQAGVKVSDLKTVTDFINAGKAINAKFPKSYIINLGPQPVQYWIGELVSADPTATMADDSGNYQVTKHPAFANAFKFLKDSYDAKVTLPIDDWSSDWQQAWKDEAITGSLIASWMKFFLPGFAPAQKGKWKVALWPTLDPLKDQRYGSEAGGSVYVVPKRAQHAKEAADYLAKMFLDKKGALEVFKNGGTTPLMKSAKDELMTAIKNQKKPAEMSDDKWNTQPTVYFGPEYQDVEFQSYDYVKVFPYDPSATKEVTILTDWLNKYMAGKASLNDALKGAEDDMKSQIGNPYKL